MLHVHDVLRVTTNKYIISYVCLICLGYTDTIYRCTSYVKSHPTAVLKLSFEHVTCYASRDYRLTASRHHAVAGSPTLRYRGRGQSWPPLTPYPHKPLKAAQDHRRRTAHSTGRPDSARKQPAGVGSPPCQCKQLCMSWGRRQRQGQRLAWPPAGPRRSPYSRGRPPLAGQPLDRRASRP